MLLSHVLSALTNAQVDLLAVTLGVCVSILGGTVHTVVRIGRVLQQQIEQDRRIDRNERHLDQHDSWHMQRGDH